MTDREKLIHLIMEAVGGCSRYWASVIADHLILNGVTIDEGGKWIRERMKGKEK